jgi:hypothetical protein
MASAYLALAVIAALGLALGWRLTPAPRQHPSVEGLARLLQLGIAMAGLLVVALLLVPWFIGLSQISCTPEHERASACIIGLRDRALFGAAAFACLIGAGFAFILRKGVFVFPAPAPVHEPAREGGVGDMDTMTGAQHRAKREPAPAPKVEAKPAPKVEAEPAPKVEAKPAPKAEAESAPKVEAEPAPAQPTAAPSPDPAEDQPASAAATTGTGHRRLQGPVFRAFVDDDAVELGVAIQTAAKRLRSERVAVVFSRGASKAANVALLELAEAFDAYRYVLEGTAAATEGVPTGQVPDPNAADEVAGANARHAGELALDLAGEFIQTVFLLDTRVAFPEFVLGKLTRMQSVCIAHAHDEVSAACQVVLPGTNPGEREGELINSDGGTNSRRPRESLVVQIVAALRALDQPDAKPES